MRGWRCDRCGQLVFLDNDTCLRCGAVLGFRPSTLAVEALDDGTPRCSTAAFSGCTFVVEDDRADGRCVACRTVSLTAPLDHPATAAAHREASADHRHVVVQLLELGLPVDAVELRLPSSRHEDVVTGHLEGVVTIDVEETDDVRRERTRERLDEPYRTFLGHLRHEYAHAMFPHVVGEADLARVRAVFGDERSDYRQALDRHYAQGPPPGWEQAHVSAYATMHPSEDWAETFAHVLHVTDVVGTADAFGLRLDPDVLGAAGIDPAVEPDPTRRPPGLEAQLDLFVPLSYALNAVGRALGEGRLYPFTLSGPVVGKLLLVGELLGLQDGAGPGAP